MYHLATVIPRITRLRRLPFTRDQVMLLMAAVNEILLGMDTFFAHSISGAIRPYEWIPVLFGPTAGGILLLAGLIALRQRPLATVLATVVFTASIIVGALGATFHIARAVLPSGPAGQKVIFDLFFWAPPVLGPLAFALVGILGLSAAWIELPPDSGILDMLGGRRWHLPYAKTQAYFYMVSMGTMIALISSALDHARTQFQNPWVWAPVAAGVFGVVVAAVLGAIDRPTRADLIVYAAAMLILILVGLIGAFLHIQRDLIGNAIFVPERFLRGAPFLAPMLFANMGMIGLIVMLDPKEEHS